MPVFVIPLTFVFLWSTGFIGAKLGLPYSEPFTFLTVRFLIVVVLLAAWAQWQGVRWPKGWEAWHMVVAGVLVHGLYLGGVFAAIHRGMPAGLSALIVGLQPLITACLVGPLLGERLILRQWLGFVLGLVGVALVISEKLALEDPTRLFSGFGWDAVALNVVALFGITFGTLYQKRYGGGQDLRAATVVQYVAAAALTGALALAFETREIIWSADFVIALGWLVLVLSIGAVSLLMLLIRRGAAATTASLFYLVPPSTALVAYFLFDERLGLTALLGMGVVALGVALVVRPTGKSA